MPVRFDFRDFNRVFNRLNAYVATEAMPLIGHITIEDIRANSAQGLDANRQTMAPYTSLYVGVRKDHGLQTDHVDLRFKRSGSILDLLATEGNRVSVPSSKEGQAEGLQKKRDWLNVGKPTIEKIETALALGINKLV